MMKLFNNLKFRVLSDFIWQGNAIGSPFFLTLFSERGSQAILGAEQILTKWIHLVPIERLY